jgi:hypothetical protein
LKTQFTIQGTLDLPNGTIVLTSDYQLLKGVTLRIRDPSHCAIERKKRFVQNAAL